VNCCPSNLLSGSTLPPPLPCVNKYTVYKCTVCKKGGMYGALGLRQINTCRKVPSQVIFLDDDILHCILWVLSFYGWELPHPAILCVRAGVRSTTYMVTLCIPYSESVSTKASCPFKCKMNLQTWSVYLSFSVSFVLFNVFSTKKETSFLDTVTFSLKGLLLQMVLNVGCGT
jgi:hypothetical protein